MTTESTQILSFGDICVDARTGEVFKAGIPVQLEPKGFRLLVFLIENRERLVEKVEILSVVWKGTIVTEYALTGAIAKLRRAIGDDTKTPRYIQTVHTRGYRFIAAVECKYPPGSNEGGGGVEADALRGPGELQEAAPGPHAAGNTTVTGIGLRRLLSPRWLVWAGAVGVLLIGVRLFWNPSTHVTQSVPSSAIRSLAVQPFQSLTADGGDEYLGAAIADALTAKLSSSATFRIRPQSAELHDSGAQPDLLAFGRTSKVDYVVGGISRSQGDRLLITAHLVRVRDGGTVWSSTFDEKTASILQLQDSICEKLEAALAEELGSQEQLWQARRFT